MVTKDVLDELIETERGRFGVPGAAVAIVAEGEVVVCDGFGVRDLETGDPVTASTHFPIASDSKAFTAALLCLLADEGRLDLDAPVREIVPWFELHDPHATALVTPRDLISHRTGLPRHDFVWLGNSSLSKEDVVQRLRFLPANRQPRQTWQYNNLCYVAAGYLTEVVTGQSWDDAVRDRLLTPLGMTETFFSPRDPAVTALAQPYKSVDGVFALQPLPENRRGEMSTLGPAGGIVSSARDMAKWVLARLGVGPRVLSDDVLAQLHSPAMLGGPELISFPEVHAMGYALGCEVASYRGHRIIRHGGNLNGYSSNVVVAPGAGAAIVVLTNAGLEGTGLREALPLAVLDVLLKLDPLPWGPRCLEFVSAYQKGAADSLLHHQARATTTPPSRDLDGFVGTYEHPAYGALGISVVEEQLVPDFHDLGEGLSLSHRGHDAWDLTSKEYDATVPLVFAQGPDGAISSLSVALEPMVEPIVFQRVSAVADATLLEALVGSYTLGPYTVAVRHRGTDLIASVPGAGDLVLVSCGGTEFSCPGMPSLHIEARVGGDGAVEALVVEPFGVFERDGHVG